MAESGQKPALEPREVAFCGYVALGHDHSDAYRRAYKAKRLTTEIIAKRADRLAQRQDIRDRVAMCVNEFKLEQLDSLGKCYSELIDSLAQCKLSKNWAAYFSGMRLRLQCMGMLKENIHLTSEQKLSDEQLLDRLGSKDPHAKAMIKAVLGSGDAYSA
jgi:hypothetical protein